MLALVFAGAATVVSTSSTLHRISSSHIRAQVSESASAAIAASCLESFLIIFRFYFISPINTFVAKMFLEHCTSEQLKEIYNDLHATEESIKNDVQYLIEWMEKQPHLPKIKGEFPVSWG